MYWWQMCEEYYIKQQITIDISKAENKITVFSLKYAGVRVKLSSDGVKKRIRTEKDNF